MEARVLLNYKEFAYFIENTKKTTILQQVTGGNTPNLVLKRMQGHFLKNPLLKKKIEYQDYEAYTKKKISNQKLNQ